MDKRDLYIKKKLQEDKTISNKCNEVFKNFKGGTQMIDHEKKIIKISLKSFIGIAASVVIVGAIGVSFYAKSKGKPNLISSIEALVKNEDDRDEIARGLFEEAVLAIRDTNRYCEYEDEIKEINGIYYRKTNLYNEEIEEKLSETFAGEALNNVLALNFYNIGGIVYAVSTAGPGYTIEDIEIQRINEENEVLTYRATYTIRYVDGAPSEKDTCEFKIKKIERENIIENGDNQYRIFETNYMGLDKKRTMAEKINEAELENHIESEIGVSFNYPSDWKYVDNQHGSGVVSVGLNKPRTNENNEYNEITFTIQWLSNDVNTTPKQYIEEGERVRGNYNEKGDIRFGDYKGYYCVGDFYQRKDFNYKTICINVNSSMYEITFGGDITLYNKYYSIFEKMLETVRFSTPTNSEFLPSNSNQEGNNNNTNNNIETNNNISTQKEKILLGDVNCDGVVNNNDLTLLSKYLNNQSSLTSQGRINSDVNDDEEVTQGDYNILKEYLSNKNIKLPNRTSGLEMTTKAVPSMKIKYPSNWTVTEINKPMWGAQLGEPTCIFEGEINNVKITVKTFEPVPYTGSYVDLIKSECEKYGITYNKKIGEGGYNIGSTNSNNLEWRCIPVIPNSTSYYYHIVDGVNAACKIEVKYFNYSDVNNMLPAYRIVDDIIFGITIGSY